MNYALKVLLKEPFHLLKNVYGRMFLRLCWSLGNIPRHSRRRFKLLGSPFEIVDSWSFLWQFHEIFFKGAYAFTSENEQPVIIDCGANIGLSVVYFKLLYPKSRIICFEPDPDIFKIMSDNTIGLSDVSKVDRAVWNHADGIKIKRNHSDGAFVSDEGEVLKSFRLKDELAKHESVDLLKMDIEGAEFTVIEDCKDELYKVQRLFIELHTFADCKQGISSILNIVEQAGFRYYIENDNQIKQPLKGDWRKSETGMDVQLNLYAIKADESTLS